MAAQRLRQVATMENLLADLERLIGKGSKYLRQSQKKLLRLLLFFMHFLVCGLRYSEVRNMPHSEVEEMICHYRHLAAVGLE